MSQALHAASTPGRAMQVDHMLTQVDHAWFQRLNLKYDEMLFKLCSRFQLAPLQPGEELAARAQVEAFLASHPAMADRFQECSRSDVTAGSRVRWGGAG